MKKKTFNIILIVCLVLLLFPIVWNMHLMISYIKTCRIYGYDKFMIKYIVLYTIICIILFIIFAALIFLLIRGNHEEIKSYAIDFKARRAEKKHAKTEAEKERLKAKLEELEEESNE